VTTLLFNCQVMYLENIRYYIYGRNSTRHLHYFLEYVQLKTNNLTYQRAAQLMGFPTVPLPVKTCIDMWYR